MFAILAISDICFKSVSYFLLGNFMMPVALWADSFTKAAMKKQRYPVMVLEVILKLQLLFFLIIFLSLTVLFKRKRIVSVFL